jgi:hypothetical protein
LVPLLLAGRRDGYQNDKHNKQTLLMSLDACKNENQNIDVREFQNRRQRYQKSSSQRMMVSMIVSQLLLFLLSDFANAGTRPITTAFVVNNRHPSKKKSASSLFYKRGDDAREDSSALEVTSAPATKNSRHVNTIVPGGWKTTDQLWDQEWHDAFLLNDLADFAPPLTDHLFCLMVGDGGTSTASHEDHALPWIQKAFESAEHPPVGVLSGSEDSMVNDDFADYLSDDEALARRLSPLTATTATTPTSDHPFRYDCIFDTSLMNGKGGGESFSTFDVGMLLYDATKSLQEYGIYVVVTKEPMASAPVKDFLIEASKILGMEWKFDLDEVSKEGLYVSVARKFFVAALPSFGKLARTATSDGPQDFLSALDELLSSSNHHPKADDIE